MDKKLHEVLHAREDRVKRQIELLKKYHAPLLSVTLNIPGSTKDNDPIRYIFFECLQAVKGILKKNKNIEILYEAVVFGADGPESLLVVGNISLIDLKKIAVKIEDEHSVGRLFDIDVIDEKYHKISRQEVNKPLRKCIICNNQAYHCIALRKHLRKDIIEKAHKLIDDYIRLNKNR